METRSDSETRPGKRRRVLLLLIAGLVLVPLLLYSVVRVFLVQAVRVEGAAMWHTLHDGDRILVWKQESSLQRGDLVVFYYPKDQSKRFIKRVIGLPGETVDLDAEGRITINGQPIAESYVATELNETARKRWNQVQEEFKHVATDSYFVMGDNRDASNDSRTFGLVPKSLIYGKVLSRYWPLGQQPK